MSSQNMLGPEDAEDQETKADILEEARTCGVVEQVRDSLLGELVANLCHLLVLYVC